MNILISILLFILASIAVAGDYLHSHYRLMYEGLKIVNGQVYQDFNSRLTLTQVEQLSESQALQIEEIRARWMASYDVVKLGGIVAFSPGNYKWKRPHSISIARQPFQKINLKRMIIRARAINRKLRICLPVSIRTDIGKFTKKAKVHKGNIPNFKKWVNLTKKFSGANCMFIDWATTERLSASSLDKMVKHVHRKGMSVILNAGHSNIAGKNARFISDSTKLKKNDYIHEEAWYFQGNNNQRFNWKKDSEKYTTERGLINKAVTKNGAGWIANIKPTAYQYFRDCGSPRIRDAVKAAFALGASHISVQKDDPGGIISNCRPWSNIIGKLSKNTKKSLKKKYTEEKKKSKNKKKNKKAKAIKKIRKNIKKLKKRLRTSTTVNKRKVRKKTRKLKKKIRVLRRR